MATPDSPSDPRPPDPRSSGPRSSGRGTPTAGSRSGGLVLSPWNLLLLLPLLMLVTPWFNRVTPRLAGLPFFYWYQFAFVIVGVASVWIVYLTTRSRSERTDGPDRLGVDELAVENMNSGENTNDGEDRA